MMVWILGLLVVGSLLACRRGGNGGFRALGLGLLVVVLVAALVNWHWPL